MSAHAMTARAGKGIVRTILVASAVLFLQACGINNVPTLEEHAKSAWSEVQNQYQRRADLVPNLVETVRGYAQHERDVLREVTEARARATQVQVDASTITEGRTGTTVYQAVPVPEGVRYQTAVER